MLKPLIVFLICLPSLVFAQRDQLPQSAGGDKQILNAFNKADAHMTTGQYDSAQFWLNKIYTQVSYRRPSLFSYYLTSRQAEVYYYNNLHELGLLEANKAETIARVLKDSTLLLDAYNFKGLFNLNKNKYVEAIRNFKLGLKAAPKLPHKPHHIELSELYHIYGNLAEAFEKSNQPDSAIRYCRLSLKKAKEIASGRGEATATLNLGMAFIQKQSVDSALKYFELSRQYADASKAFDVELTTYGGLAECAAISNNRPLALAQLDKGFALLKAYPQTNDYYLSIFLDAAVKIYRKYSDNAALSRTLQLRTDIQKATYDRSNMQIQSLVLMGLQNEKKIFELELAESQNKQNLAITRSYILMLIILVIVIAFIAYRYYALQRLKMANVRSKISQDLHDEVGATLSGIAMYSYITKEQVKNGEAVAVNNSLDIIKDNAGEMVAKLNDIVWAVNPIQDHLSALIDRLKEFAIQIAAAKNIKAEFVYDPGMEDLKLPMEARQNVYLICKEAINNSVKYSCGNLLRVTITVSGRQLEIEIQDNGDGFAVDNGGSGNGLMNMRNRAKDIGGKLTIDSKSGNGTRINLNCKIT
ncbi:tetratricopeptide repeat-containing sensor histidine kinase [Mucilaginibacter myungsuensis]|uniref:Histidine kinase domain-containing protein n=1 Tax=Mucilaginibacter myungsuensis TaxID=649104 RepID=A0A929L0L3_9SPHI|nr:ATP-binding protein [Mucilaginibacter myungsuensis]MBE9663928.1 hypothetical protein [Mucilaginibacter myungsuensis]MDN3598356.1 ATP-binding protein [Mucilaginibacter myungsuensis]